MTSYRRIEGSLRGSIAVPGDKSIGHRALMLGALSEGITTIKGLSRGLDNSATATCLRQLGVEIVTAGETTRVHGVGLSGLRAPLEPLNCGNSGTTMRLMLGILAGQDFESKLVGDASLAKRPMKRVLEPLSRMGLEVLEARDHSFCPLRIRGKRPLGGLVYDSPIASAQVKSAILLAGLYSDGEVRVNEPSPSRDHTERMLAYLGDPPQGKAINVPGDLSSAAFLLAAALLVPDSLVTIEGVGINPTRTGVLDVLSAMGAGLTITNKRLENNEPLADVVVEHGSLRAFSLDEDLAVRAIDELPLLAVLASRAEGTSHIRHAAELRVKESDRIAKTCELLRSFGVSVTEFPDGLSVHGDPNGTFQRGQIDARGDHRIAMCAALLGMVAPDGVDIEGLDAIQSSFPSFFSSLATLGLRQEFDGAARQSKK